MSYVPLEAQDICHSGRLHRPLLVEPHVPIVLRHRVFAHARTYVRACLFAGRFILPGRMKAHSIFRMSLNIFGYCRPAACCARQLNLIAPGWVRVKSCALRKMFASLGVYMPPNLTPTPSIICIRAPSHVPDIGTRIRMRRRPRTRTKTRTNMNTHRSKNVFPSVRPVFRPSIRPSCFPSVRPSFHPSFCLSVRPPFLPSVRASV